MEPQTKSLEIAFTDAASRLADLQRGQALTNERVAGIEATLTGMRERFDRGDERFNTVDERFNKVDERFNRVDERFNKVDERLDKIDVRFNKVDERLDKVDERLDKIDVRFNKVDERLDKIDERFNKVDNNFADVKLAIAMLSQRMEDGFRSFHEKLEERPTKVQLLRWVVGLLLAVISVGSGVGAYLLRAHGDITAAEVIDAARGS